MKKQLKNNNNKHPLKKQKIFHFENNKKNCKIDNNTINNNTINNNNNTKNSNDNKSNPMNSNKICQNSKDDNNENKLINSVKPKIVSFLLNKIPINIFNEYTNFYKTSFIYFFNSSDGVFDFPINCRNISYLTLKNIMFRFLYTFRIFSNICKDADDFNKENFILIRCVIENLDIFQSMYSCTRNIKSSDIKKNHISADDYYKINWYREKIALHTLCVAFNFSPVLNKWFRQIATLIFYYRLVIMKKIYFSLIFENSDNICRFNKENEDAFHLLYIYDLIKKNVNDKTVERINTNININTKIVNITKKIDNQYYKLFCDQLEIVVVPKKKLKIKNPINKTQKKFKINHNYSNENNSKNYYNLITSHKNNIKQNIKKKDFKDCKNISNLIFFEIVNLYSEQISKTQKKIEQYYQLHRHPHCNSNSNNNNNGSEFRKKNKNIIDLYFSENSEILCLYKECLQYFCNFCLSTKFVVNLMQNEKSENKKSEI